MKVPFLDIKAQNSLLSSEISAAMSSVVEDTAFVLGPYVEKFEREYAEFCNAKYCVGVNSGTSALHLALLAHGIGPGDEVILPPNSFIATAWAITYCGAQPVFVDVCPDTFLLNPDLIESAITAKTKMILPVHLYGQPADMDEINRIAEKHDLVVVEDAAQAHAATYKGKIIGSGKNTACFSFYPGKNLGAIGEGGAIVTPDSSISARAQMLRDHGQSEKYRHDFIGFNYRMDGIQGAVLSTKLKCLSAWTQARRELAGAYLSALKGFQNFELPTIKSDRESAFHLFVVHSEERDALADKLAGVGISTGKHYPIPIHLQKAYRFLEHAAGDFPVAEKNARECLSLPLFPELTRKELGYVTSCIWENS